MSKKRDITGERFSRLVAVEPSGHLYGRSAWLFHCDCGNDVIATLTDVVSGKKKSCGCFRKEATAKRAKTKNVIHGKTGTRLWSIWSGMRRRCKANPGYKNISVCKEWEDFTVFYEWAIRSGYDDSLTIDRIDVYGDYSPENCRWTTYKIQANNKTNNTRITFNGETRTISEWSDITGIRRDTLSNRLKNGWPLEDVFSNINWRSKNVKQHHNHGQNDKKP